MNESAKQSTFANEWHNEINWIRVGSYWVQEIEVSPELAEKMLVHMSPNRNLRPRARDAYLREIEAGRWHKNGATIVFDEQGRLLDGQHRLQAIAEGTIAVPFLTVFGINPNAMPSIDTGIIRTAGDVATLGGVPNARMAMAAARTHLAYLNAISGKATQKLLTSELWAHLENEPRLRVACSRVVGDSDLRKLTGAAGVAGYFICSAISPVEAEQFFARLSDGANLSVTDPEYVTRRCLINTPTHDAPLTTLEIIIIGWNAKRRRRPIKVIRTRTGDRFPAAI